MTQKRRVNIPVEPANVEVDEPTRWYELPDWAASEISGYLTLLAKSGFWSGDNEERTDAIVAIDQIQQYLANPQDGIPVLNANGITRFNDSGQMQRWSSATNSWQNVTASEQCGCGEISTTTVRSQFSIDNTDRYCLAAQKLASYFADGYQDFLQIIQLGTNVTLQSGESLAEIVASIFIPAIGQDFVDPIFEWFTEGLAAPALTWMVQAAGDIGAQDKAAEIIYCAMVEAESLDDWDNIATIIENEIPSNFAFNSLLDVPNFAIEILNGTGVIDAIFATLQESNAGYAIVGFGLLFTKLYEGVLGLDNATEQILSWASTNAQAFDSRDCSSYPCFTEPCLTYDFSQIAILPDNSNVGTSSDFVPNLGIISVGAVEQAGSEDWRATAEWAIDVGQPLWIERVFVNYTMTNGEGSGSSLGSVWTIAPFEVLNEIDVPNTSSIANITVRAMTEPDKLRILIRSRATTAIVASAIDITINQIQICSNSEVINWISSQVPLPE